MPYILTKFFEKKSYQEDFIKGNFYLSSLATFTKTYAERGLMEAAAQGDRYAREILKKQRNKSQRDVLEGTIASIPPSRAKEFPADMRSVMCTDMMIRALGYGVAEVSLCFDYKEIKHIIIPTLDEYRQLVENIDLWELHDEKYDILSKIIVWERSRGDF